MVVPHATQTHTHKKQRAEHTSSEGRCCRRMYYLAVRRGDDNFLGVDLVAVDRTT